MMKNKTVIVVIILFLVAVLGYWYMNNQRAKTTGSSNTLYPSTTVTPSAASGQGHAVIVIKDATAPIENVSSVAVTIDKVELHNRTSGWGTISTASQTYDLLALKKANLAMLLVDANIAAGTYEQIRLHVSKVMVTASGKTTEAKLPSNSLKIVGNFTVVAGETSSAIIDILADKSLHLTGSGKYLLAPVVRFQTETASNVEVKQNGSVEFNGGKPETDIRVGMNEKGEVRNDFELDEDLNVDLDEKNNIRVNGAIVVPIKEDDESSTEVEEEDDSESTSSRDEDEKSSSITLNFVAQNNSGVSGTASLTQVDGKVKVELKTSGGILALVSPSEPAHIHTGSCANIGAVKYPLSNVIAGRSTTVVDASLNDLKAGLPLAINVHKSSAAIGTYIACTDLKF